MQYSEDSVVVALDQVRRLRHHQGPQGGKHRDHARQAVRIDSEALAGYAEAKPSPQVDAFAGWNAPASRGGAAVAAQTWQAPAFAEPDPAASSPDYQALAAAAGLRKSGSGGKAFLMLLLFGAVGAGGYFAYQEHLAAQATIASRDAALRRAEDTTRQAIEDRSRAEKLAATKIAALEEKLAAAEARASAPAAAAPAAAAPAAPAAEPAAASPAPRHARADKPSKAAKARAARELAKADEKLEADKHAKPAKQPKIAPKRSLSDDPLAGLKLR